MSCKKTSIGGQALIEGVFMLGPNRSAIAVRKPDGEITVKTDEVGSASGSNSFSKLPFIRGVVGLVRSMKRGMAALNYSASFAIDEDDENYKPGKFELWLERKFGSKKVEKALMGFATLLGIVIPIFLFIFLPTLLAGTLDKLVGSGIWRNLIEGGIRIVIFLVFMFSMSRMKDMKRVFSYHGAEHKSIFCYESGEELTVENAKRFPKEHPRCGTSFLFTVMIISVLVFSVVSWSNPWIRMALRLALLPVVVSISYEANRLIGRYDNPLTRALRAPGKWFQTFTTFEPDDSMLEVALEALRPVIPENSEEDKW